ncbi:MAG: hypothetical protein AB1726_13455, partial [Planctomycetota bacterium]
LVERAKAGGERGLRVFPFGVGEDVDAGLLCGIAAAGRGRAEIFRPGGEIATRLTAFLRRTSAPVLADLALAVDGVAVHDVYPRPLPDAYLGEQVAISGRFRGAGPGTVTLSATIGGERASLAVPVDFPAAAGGSPLVAQLFARAKLAHLEETRRIRLGLADDAYYAALGRGAYSTADEIVAEMVAVSLGHGVQCAYTSFLALLPEDRARIDPRDEAALRAALERARADVGRPPREPRVAAGGEETEPAEEIEEEILAGAEISDHDESDDDPDFHSDDPFDSDAFDDVLGIGGGAGGQYGARLGGRRNLRAHGGAAAATVPREGGWLVRHQDAGGRWDSDGFARHCAPGAPCDGAGDPDRDVGVTGLALLALLADGNTIQQGPERNAVRQGVAWLGAQQDPATGLFGPPIHPHHLLDHAIATQALCEAYYFAKSPLLRPAAQAAVDALAHARTPGGAWSHDPAGTGTPDTTVTGWVILALAAARDAKLVVDAETLAAARAWIDATAAAEAQGGASETAIAMAILGRVLLDRDLPLPPGPDLGVERLLARLATRSWTGSEAELEFWLFGTYALFQLGGPPGVAGEEALQGVLGAARRPDGPIAGTWDPAGLAGEGWGRAGTTAIASLCEKVTWRTSRLAGAR